MWSDEMETRSLQITDQNGQPPTFTQGEILRHVITHEIHHVPDNVIGRELMERKKT
jgi:uncharacterized damage-inducible protein DinB